MILLEAEQVEEWGPPLEDAGLEGIEIGGVGCTTSAPCLRPVAELQPVDGRASSIPLEAVSADRGRRSRAMSWRITVRLAPAPAPTIAVRSASRSTVAWNPSQAPASPPPIASAKPVDSLLVDQSRCTQAE